VKRNHKRFPIDFCFELTKYEFLIWKSQFATSKNDKKGLRKLPYAFTEYGFAMLSSILRSKKAIMISILIIDAFIAMHKILSFISLY
jgi:hypothetical protein